MDCSKCEELSDTLKAAHAAFMREKARADAAEFRVERLERDIHILKVEQAAQAEAAGEESE